MIQTLATAQRLIDVFRSVDPEFSPGMIACFLTIARFDGISQHQIAERIGHRPASVSRFCAMLAEYGRGGKAGLRLITIHECPSDRRLREMRLTPKGQAVIENINHALAPQTLSAA
ncbi:DNA-binding MarR family transcriptional regulator [Natronocella acetinitrilica]|uniref:DNA-binding MarR family transcriptional regulator n=1 Tax=Natronocella acetinitrilica TaxID=414046 RepID=A0AAE3KFQ3_9GAMM|nr:MarR family winged helix-turn-helix transcriptional regulator [Natronocella acetinitrilica]MCP1674317.1 DNA-binding MarR family transcriptional regulator [Natronocella acetinitrilica]